MSSSHRAIEQHEITALYGFLALCFIYCSAGLSLFHCSRAAFVSLFSKALQVLTEVQKQMGFFDAELKDSRRRAEEMQQAPLFLVFVSDRHEIVDVFHQSKTKS